MESRDKTEKKSLIKTLAELALTFFRIGLFTFGGGYAMISIIEHDCVEKRAWITHDDMMNITVIAESTPGPVAINCATFVGYKRAGKDALAVTILSLSFAAMLLINIFALDFSSISLMLISAAVSLAAYCVSLLKNRKEGEK